MTAPTSPDDLRIGRGRRAMIALLAAGAIPSIAAAQEQPPTGDPFAPLAIYDGEWRVRAVHPWSGAPIGAVDRLTSRCRRFTAYFACEQTIDGKPASLIVYTVGERAGRLQTRTIAPDGLAGARGELTTSGSRLTYLDKPPPTLQGPWSRVENIVIDRNHIRFEEYSSSDEGRTWTLTNAGVETRADVDGAAPSNAPS